jgi:hypothetical protein
MYLDKVSVLGLVIVRVIMIVLTVMSLDKVSVLGLVIVRVIVIVNHYNPNNNQAQY